jgi:hypothetical protein
LEIVGSAVGAEFRNCLAALGPDSELADAGCNRGG